MIMNWTAQMHAYLIQLHRDPKQLPFTAIAAALSERFGVPITRNACIGKAMRLGLPTRPGSNGELRHREVLMKQSMMPIRIDAPIEAKIKTAPGLPGVSIYQLKSRTCRWPLDPTMNKPPFRYCGCRTVEAGMPYCAEHTARATGKVYVPRRQAV